MTLLEPPTITPEDQLPYKDDFDVVSHKYYQDPDEVLKKYSDPERIKSVIHYLEEKVFENNEKLTEITSKLADIKIQLNKVDTRMKELKPEIKPFMIEDAPLNIVERSGWGAYAMKSGMRLLKHPITKVNFTFSTATESCDNPETCAKLIKKIQIRDMTAGLPDIAHNFLVAEDGNVYEGRGWHLAPACADTDPNCESNTVDIAFAGNFDSDSYPLELFETAVSLVDAGIEKKFVSENYKML